MNKRLKKIIHNYHLGNPIRTQDLNYAIPLLKQLVEIAFPIEKYRLMAQDALRIVDTMEDWLEARK